MVIPPLESFETMLRMSLSARRKASRTLGSALAAALALAGASAMAAPAAAQAQQQAAQPQLKASKNFGKVYEPVAAIANADAGDFAGAKAQLPAVLAAAESADDRYLAGTLHYVLGNKLNDAALKRQGMELILQSGKATPEIAGEVNYFLGEAAYDAQDWAKARQYFQAARTAGYTGGNAEGLTAESYFKEGQAQQGLAYLEGLVKQRTAAGQQVPDVWIRRALKVAYDNKNLAEAGKWSALLVENAPTPENWTGAIQVLDAMPALQPAAKLDLLRLAAATNSLKDRRSVTNYIEFADARVMANEVSRVLEAGKSAGVFSDADGQSYYNEIKQIVGQRLSGERAEAAQYAASAAAAANGKPAQNAGELYLGLQDYAKAEEMLKLALSKGGIDRDAVLTRLGIVQAQQGKAEEAKANFAQVGGDRSAVAKLWSAYVDSRNGG